MLQIVICDDKKEHARFAGSLIEKELSNVAHDVEYFSSGGQLLSACSIGDFLPDIAVLDIEMGDMSGIELAIELNTLVPACAVIFLTGYIDYAQEAYAAEHVWYVLKKDAEKHFGMALKRAMKYVSGTADMETELVIKNRSNITRFAVDDVVYIERTLRKTVVYTKAGRTAETTLSADDLLKNIPENIFLRCHQSYRVNLSCIAEMDKDEFIMKNGTRIPISRAYKQRARTAFLNK